MARLGSAKEPKVHRLLGRLRSLYRHLANPVRPHRLSVKPPSPHLRSVNQRSRVLCLANPLRSAQHLNSPRRHLGSHRNLHQYLGSHHSQLQHSSNHLRQRPHSDNHRNPHLRSHHLHHLRLPFHNPHNPHPFSVKRRNQPLGNRLSSNPHRVRLAGPAAAASLRLHPSHRRLCQLPQLQPAQRPARRPVHPRLDLHSRAHLGPPRPRRNRCLERLSRLQSERLRLAIR